MKLMMLGASSAQLAGIRTAQAMGHQVVVCDYLPEAPGHRLADHSVLASTFDYEAVLTAARAFRIDGIMTMGTDQPVYTAARVAKALELPSLLSPETALAVTHKGVMKRRLAQGVSRWRITGSTGRERTKASCGTLSFRWWSSPWIHRDSGASGIWSLRRRWRRTTRRSLPSAGRRGFW